MAVINLSTFFTFLNINIFLSITFHLRSDDHLQTGRGWCAKPGLHKIVKQSQTVTEVSIFYVNTNVVRTQPIAHCLRFIGDRSSTFPFERRLPQTVDETRRWLWFYVNVIGDDRRLSAGKIVAHNTAQQKQNGRLNTNWFPTSEINDNFLKVAFSVREFRSPHDKKLKDDKVRERWWLHEKRLAKE